MEILIVAVVIGLLPAFIASSKGYSFASWWFFGAVFFILALPMALVKPKNPAKFRKCPSCAEWIDRAAIVCPRCSRDVAVTVPGMPPAGWYAAPEGQSGQIYWDGGAWTPARRGT